MIPGTLRKSLLALCAALAACSGGSSGPTGTNTGGNNSGNVQNAITVNLNTTTSSDGYGYNYSTSSFAPTTATISRGGTVTWVNASNTVHNITFTPAAGVPENIADHATGVNTRTFNTAGTFAYRCTNHENMSGVVEVK